MKTFWSGRNVFVTGAYGLLGPWLVDMLVDQKANVLVLERDYPAHARFFSAFSGVSVQVLRGDVTDYQTMVRALNEYRIDTVFHLAAQAIVGTALRNPLSTFESNVRGTWNVLEAVRLSPWVKAVVVASSDKAYGAAESLPYTESTPLNGKYPYDASKSCTDIIAQSYAYTFNVPVVITRCGNFFGGGDLHFNRIVPGTIRSLYADQQPLIRSNGLFVRDYIYVKDVAHAYMLLAEQMHHNPELRGEAYNISTDTPLNVIQIVQKIAQLMGKEHLKPLILAEASQEIFAQHLSSHKIRTQYGWSPVYGIDKGLEETIAWYGLYFNNQDARSFELKRSVQNTGVLYL